MAAPPELDDNARNLLKRLVSRASFVRGAEAMKMIGMDDREKFSALVEKLAAAHLLLASGSLSPERIEYATLSVHPENISFVRDMY
jgi:hypothetical protein